MKKALLSSLAILFLASGSIAVAQTSTDANPDPKILQVTVEYTKPGKGGAMHDKSESAFMATMGKANVDATTIGLNSLSGKPAALFLTWYDSFAAMDKLYSGMMKNKSLMSDLDKESITDGEMLDSVTQGIYAVDTDDSFHSHKHSPAIRFLSVSTFHIRSGHGKDWEDLVKLVESGYDKAGVPAHWGAYDLLYGGTNDTEILLRGEESLGTFDGDLTDGKKLNDALGADGMKKLHELYAAAVESQSVQLYAVNPSLSYVPESWVKEAPGFWKSHTPAAAPAAKPAAAKPAATK